MKIAIYQDNLGSASGIHWWLSQEINVGPEVYSFTDGYLRPAHNHIGGIVIEDGMHPHHNLYNSTFTELDKTENTLIDPFAKMEEMTKDFDTILWSNYSGNLANPDNIMWGTDWPHPNKYEVNPNDGDLVDAFGEWVTDDAMRQKIMVTNPEKFYAF